MRLDPTMPEGGILDQVDFWFDVRRYHEAVAENTMSEYQANISLIMKDISAIVYDRKDGSPQIKGICGGNFDDEKSAAKLRAKLPNYRDTMVLLEHQLKVIKRPGTISLSQLYADIYGIKEDQPVYIDIGTKNSPKRVDKAEINDRLKINYHANEPLKKMYVGIGRQDLDALLGFKEPVGERTVKEVPISLYLDESHPIADIKKRFQFWRFKA